MEITLIPIKDGSLMGHDPNNNYGDGINTPIWHWSGGHARPIFAFNINQIPRGATIISATFSVYYYLKQSQDPSWQKVWAYKITRNDWEELQATWNIFKTSNSWTSAGGDFVTSNPVGGDQVFPASYGWLNFNVKAIVEDALANRINVNIITKFESEISTDSSNYFYSKEYETDTSKRPKLVIEYEGGLLPRRKSFSILHV